LPSSDNDTEVNTYSKLTIDETKSALIEIDNTIDKIDAALPGVRDLDNSDEELDELATMAKDSFNDLSDLGMQVDSRYASEIFAVAGAMLGHALTAKTAKMNKKLKMIQLQLQKAKLDLDREKTAGTSEDDDVVETAEGQVLSRNDLLDRLIGTREQKNKPA
jgi:DNA-directed RNA polymerase beta' subunit